MTSNALRVSGQTHTGTQTDPPLSAAYDSLHHSEETRFNDRDNESDLKHWPQSSLEQSRLMTWTQRHYSKGLTICAFTAITLMVLSTLVLRKLITTSFPRDDCSYQGSRINLKSLLYSPMGEAFKYQVRTISSSVSAPSKYKGPINPNVDRAWRDLFQGNHIRISPEDMVKMNRTSVRLNGGPGDYIATPETYHQLHCLWYIFQFAHPEAYTVESHHGVSVSAHVDHCIDSLRKFVQCHASASVQTYSWKPETRVPESDVDIPNVCVDWDTYDGWVKDHSFDAYEPGLLVHPVLGSSFPDGETPRGQHAYPE